MRLATEKVKSAILHPNAQVRGDAVWYFCQSHSPDPTIVPSVIKAIETYGWQAAFSHQFIVTNLVLSESSLDWFIRELREGKPETPETALFRQDVCELALVLADAELLRHFEPELDKLTVLDEDIRSDIGERIRNLTRTPEEMWDELESLCAEYDEHLETTSDDPFTSENIDFAYSLIDGLARHTDRLAGRVLSLLRGGGDQFSSSLEVCAVRLAGAMQIRAAIPCLIDFLGAHGSWDSSECRWALVRMRSDIVVRAMSNYYATLNSLSRASVAEVLGQIHSEAAVETASLLLQFEADRELRMFLVRALLRNYDTNGIELGRQFLLEDFADGPALEFCPSLLRACQNMESRFPEYDDWLAESEARRLEDMRRYFQSRRTVLISGGDSGYPVARIAYFGPNDDVTTKVVVTVVESEGAVPVEGKWMGSSPRTDPTIQSQVREFLAAHDVRTTISECENVGCPHEAGVDFPAGENCPFCPYWRDRG